MQLFQRFHCFIKALVPYGLIIAVSALLLDVMTFIIDIEDKQSERLFSAWRYVIENDRLTRDYMANSYLTAPVVSNRNTEWVLENNRSDVGGATFRALELINREVEGNLCASWLQPIFRWLSGSVHRYCIIPARQRDSLANRYLPHHDLTGIILDNAEFTGTCFKSSVFTLASLRNADFRETVLCETNFFGSDLSNSDFSDSDLANAHLSSAYLVGAELSGANLRNANLYDANLAEAKLTRADLTNSYLNLAILVRSNLENATFCNTNVSGADFSEVIGLKYQQLKGMCIWKGFAPPKLPNTGKLTMTNGDWKTKLCKPREEANCPSKNLSSVSNCNCISAK